MQVERTEIVLKPDQRRVLFLPFKPARDEQILKIAARVMSLTYAEVDKELEEVCKEFADRHHKLYEYFLKRFDQISSYLISDRKLRKNRKMLIGAYFTAEYSLESAALFNPRTAGAIARKPRSTACTATSRSCASVFSR